MVKNDWIFDIFDLNNQHVDSLFQSFNQKKIESDQF